MTTIMKNVLEEINGKLNEADDQISNMEDKMVENKSEQQTQKSFFFFFLFNEDSLNDLWDNIIPLSSGFPTFLLNNHLRVIFIPLKVLCLFLCPCLRISLLYLVFNNLNTCLDVVYFVYPAWSLQTFLNLCVDVFCPL